MGYLQLEIIVNMKLYKKGEEDMYNQDNDNEKIKRFYEGLCVGGRPGRLVKKCYCTGPHICHFFRDSLTKVPPVLWF